MHLVAMGIKLAFSKYFNCIGLITVKGVKAYKVGYVLSHGADICVIIISADDFVYSVREPT